MENTTTRNKPSPEKTVFGFLTSDLRSELNSSKRKDALVTMIRSLALLFREFGIPKKWTTKINPSLNISRKRRRQDSRSPIPKRATKLVQALFELSKAEQSGELAFRILETLAEINKVLDGNLIRYLIKSEANSIVRETISLASMYLEETLIIGETKSIQTLIRFAGEIPGSEGIFKDELQRIKKTSLTRLPEVSRRLLTAEDSPETVPLVQISDPSQSVEVRQFAHLLQTSWIRHHEGELDSATFDSLQAFGKGFKNLEFVGTFGEETKFSDEYFEGDRLRAGDLVVVQVSPVIWRLGDRLRVIVKGIVKRKL